MNERERLICEVSDYFNKYNGRHYVPVHEGNVDELYEAMVKEKAEFEQTFNRDLVEVWNRPDLIEYGGNPVEPLAPVGNDRPYRIDLKDPAWQDDLEQQRLERKLEGGVVEIIEGDSGA
jgi:hypothetical protein